MTEENPPDPSDWKKLLSHTIQKDWKHVSGGWKAFLAIAVLSGFVVWYVTDKIIDKRVENKNATIEQLQNGIRAKEATIESLKTQLDSKTGVNKALQIVVYTNDPNIEGVVPPMTNAGAMAYRTDAQGGLWTWDIKSQKWR